MEPSPASAVPAASTAVTDTAVGDRTTAPEVNSTQATPASPAPAASHVPACTTPQKETSYNEPTVDEEPKKEATKPTKPAEDIDPLPGGSGKSPDAITTSPVDKPSGETTDAVTDRKRNRSNEEMKLAAVRQNVPEHDGATEATPGSTDRAPVDAMKAGSSSEIAIPTSSSGATASVGPPPQPATPPPEVESSTATPEKGPRPDGGDTASPPDAGMMCTVDSSSGSRRPPRGGDTTADLNGCSSDVNSINTCSSSSSSGKSESHQDPATTSGATNTCTSREANAAGDVPVVDDTPVRSSPPRAVNVEAVIEDNLVVGVETPIGGGTVQHEELPEPPTSSELMPVARDRLSGRDLPHQHATQEDSSVGSSTNVNTHAPEKKQRDTQPSESRESAPVPPEPDPGPSSSVQEEQSPANGSSTTESSTTKSDDGEGSSDSNKSIRTTPEEPFMRDEPLGGSAGNSARGNEYQPPPSATPNARNPLLFTEVANDEVELKVDGGHLLDRVIKLSLLKGLQDSGKRLAKSSLIISGAGANGEGSNGEATLATTSSLSKAKSAAGLRLVEDSKTTPPALVPSASVPLTNGAIGETVSVRELASSSKEVAEHHHQHPPPARVRHSSETMVSSGSGELEDSREPPPHAGGGVWSSNSSSALDFREEGRPATQPHEPQRATQSPSDVYVREPVASSDHLPVKARKPQYYASIPDFSKQSKFSPPAPPPTGLANSATSSSTASSSTTTTTTTSPAKSLAQLHMKTPDFSRLGVVSSSASATTASPSAVVVSQSSPPASASTSCSTSGGAGVRTTSELKISNPDFTKVPGFAHHQSGPVAAYPGSSQPLGSNPPPPPPPPPHGSQVSSGGATPFVSQDTFSKLIKERNYIADLQLKNPPPSNEDPTGVPAAMAPSLNDATVKRGLVVVDTTTSSSGSAPKSSSLPYEPFDENPYRQRSPAPADNGMELEPQAHVIHKKSGRPQPATSGVPKNWNPPEFSSTHFTQPPQPQGNSRPHGSANGAGALSSSSSSSPSPAPRDPSPAPSSSSSSASPYPGGYGVQPYPGAPSGYGAGKHQPPTDRIIVNNVRTYYPEQAPVPAGGSSSKQAPSQQPHYHLPGLPKVKDPEFRLDHGKEQQLLQEGTIITVKQPYAGTTPAPRHPTAARSPSEAQLARREAQMLQNSQEILYRDYRQHKRPPGGVTTTGSSRASQGPSQGPPPPMTPPQGPPGVGERRSPYDSSSSTSAYYHPMLHHPRGPMHPQQSGSGLMHPPPPSWPAGPGPPPPQRGGPAVARSSPHDNGTSPVSSPAPVPGGSVPSPNHNYHLQQHHHQQQQQHGGQQYKNSPSPVSGSAYGPASSPTQPMAAGKYPPQGPYVDRRPETDPRDPPYTKVPPAGQPAGYFKGLDFNMEQKFAEVYQAHQAKEKQAAEAAATPVRAQSSRSGAPRSAGSPGVSSASSVGGPAKAYYGAYEQYGNAFYHPHSHHPQATPSPTSTPSPVPSPHHRKYSGPPSRDPSPLGQQAPQPAALPLQPHHRHGPPEPLYHTTSGYSGPPAKPLDHAANGSHDHRGGGSTSVVPPQAGGVPYHHTHHQPSSSSAYPMPPYAGNNPPPPQQQQSVISTAYDRYQPPQHPYGGGPSSQGQGLPGQPPHHVKTLPYPPPGRQQQQPPPPPPLAAAPAAPGPPQPHAGVAPSNSVPSSYYTHPPAVAAESAVIHPPLGSKNIPVRVIATAPPAAAPSKASSSGPQIVPPGNSRGGPSATIAPPGEPATSSSASQGAVQVGTRVTPAGDGGVNADGSSTSTSISAGPVIIQPAKRESPLDLSVKTVKTKADSTGCDDYGNVCASNSSISSSSSSSSSSTSSTGSGGGVVPAATTNNRSREVVPKVDFNPNFNKHIAPSPHGSRSSSGAGGSPVAPGGRPLDPLPASQSRHVSVISPVIPPGYDKKTDAYLSANYRAVGGPLASPAYQYPPYASRGPPAGYDHPAGPAAANSSMPSAGPSKPMQHVDAYAHPKQTSSGSPGSGSGSASSKSVYYPPAVAHPPHQTAMEYARTGKSVGGSIVAGPAPPPPSTGPRPGTHPASGNVSSPVNNSPIGAPSPSQPRVDDPRIEDRKFVESMLKKKTSPSSDVIADLQSGRFPTRLPQSLVPKKRAAAAAAAAAAAEAAQSKAAGGGAGVGGVPSPAKVGKYEERREYGQEAAAPVPAFERHPPVAPVPRDGPYHGAPPSLSAKPYGTVESQSYYGPAGKRPAAPETAVHPSVITTNYHHQTPVALQQQPQHQQYHPPDMRYYQQHLPPGQSKPREDCSVAPVYHQPHLRGGSSLPYGYHPQYHHPHPDQQQMPPNHLAYQQHKDPSGQPLFRYGEPPKSSPPEPASVLHMQSHIHYTGPGVHVQKEYPPPQQAQQQQHQQQQGLSSAHGLPPTVVEVPGGMTRSFYAPYGGVGSFMVGPPPPPPPATQTAPPQHRGADQSVISKLRESLEHKEYEKQRINQLRKLPSGGGGDALDEMHPPVQSTPAPTTPVTPDAPSSSARFRTKGELKGYTPLPLPPSAADGGSVAKREGEEHSAGTPKEGIKEEKEQPPAGEGEAAGAPLLDILDWGSACNEFVEQLQTGKKRGRRKRPSAVAGPGVGGSGWRGLGPDGGELMAAGGGEGSSADLSAVPKDVLNSARSPPKHRLHASRSVSSSDEDKPLMLLLQQSQQDLQKSGQDQKQQQQVVDSHTRNILLSTVEKLTDKLARNMREKQRLELEQKHEAKLGRSSSTDSDTARLASAAAQRAKARVRKLRHRSSIVSSSVLKSSDGDGDVTADEEEPGTAKGATTGKRPPGGHQLLANSNAGKRKRLERRSSVASSRSSSSSSEGEPPEAEPEVVRRKRGRPKGSLGGAKRAQQQATMTRCQTGTLKQDPNENSDLSSDDDKPSKALRTPPAKGHGRTVGSESSAKKHRGDGGGAGNGGTSGGGTKGQQVKQDQSTTGGTSHQDGKAKHAAERERKKPTDNDGTSRKDDHAGNSNGASKKPVKQRTTSRSKTPQGHGNVPSSGGGSSSSSSSSSKSSSSSSEGEEEKEDRETMTRSKSKREAERRRSNSKVLRNDKIVENLAAPPIHHNRRARIENERTPTKQNRQTKNSRETPSTGKRSKPAESDSDRSAVAEKAGGPKKKRTRLASKNAPNSSAESDRDSSSDDDDEEGTVKVELTERLRTRRSKNRSEPTVGGGKPSSKSAPSAASTTAKAAGSRSRRESTAARSGREESNSAKKKQSSNASSGPSGSCSSGGGGGGGGRGGAQTRKGTIKEESAGTNATSEPFYPGWEKELYEFKRSVKVPPELITIDGKLYMHRISTSLPDLDSPHHSDGSETFSEIVKINQKEVVNDAAPPTKRIKTKGAAKQHQQQQPASVRSPKVKEEPQQQLLQEQQEQLKKKLNDNEKFSSIIELLHRRCLAAVLLHQGKSPAVGAGKQKGSSKVGSAKASVNNNNNNNNNNDEITVKPKQEYELLPTPGAESESLFAKNCKKKKSLFDTAILKSRTRTEQKAMQSKEMIREVFGADEERPQSAPPLRCGVLFEEGIRNVTYDEKYNELMRNVDRIVDELDGGGNGGAAIVTVKQEPNEEEEEEGDEEHDDQRAGMEEDDETQDSSMLMKDSERDTPSVASERDLLGGTPLSFAGLAIASTPAVGASTMAGPGGTSSAVVAVPEKKRRGRGHRTSRRKGSSGFDYIRKKKKPSQQHHNNHANGNQHQRGPGGSSANVNGINGINGEPFPRKKFTSAYENLAVKDETHISKEIRSWVLNKGVGESVMHKAARLGYTDVIVYCLERLDMDPDLKDNAGYTPLHEACAKGHLDIAHYLLQYGASHSEPAPSGMRPLHEAVENSFVEIVRLLLAFGADPMLATYAGLTPEALAESDSMTRFLKDHVNDVQSMGPNKTAWKFEGPWKVHDPEESGCNVFANIPGFSGEDNGSDLSSLNSSARSNCTGSSGTGGTTISPSAKRCDSNSNIMNFEAGCPNSVAPDEPKQGQEIGIPEDIKTDGEIVADSPSAVDGGLRNGKIVKRKDAALVNGYANTGNPAKPLNGGVVGLSGEAKPGAEEGEEELHDEENDGTDSPDGLVFEYEESDRPLPPLYALKDEHNERWVLMSDLCHVLKFKSKEAVLRQICPNNTANNQRDLIREMKIEDFLTRANCLQLLCAGEKLNIHASKVVLVKYNDSVKSLLQVKSVMTRI